MFIATIDWWNKDVYKTETEPKTAAFFKTEPKSFFADRTPLVPANMRVKFEVRSFNRFGATSI